MIISIEVEDASFLASLSERLAKGDEEEEEETRERAGSRGVRSHDLRLQLLSSLLDHVHTVEEVGGARAIPYMQVYSVQHYFTQYYLRSVHS